MKPEPLREKSREGFCLFGKEANRCRQNQRSRVRSPAVRICVTDSTVKHTGHRQRSSTTNTGVLPTSIKNTDAHGNASVTVILPRTRCAKNVWPKAEPLPQRKCITFFPYPAEATTAPQTWCLFAVPATIKSTVKSGTDRAVYYIHNTNHPKGRSKSLFTKKSDSGPGFRVRKRRNQKGNKKVVTMDHLLWMIVQC